MTSAPQPPGQPLHNPGPTPPPTPASGLRPAGSGQSPWVSGMVLFGGVVMLVDGVFAILRGIMGIAKDNVFVTTPTYVFRFNLTAWGWIHLLLGVVLVIVGYGVLKGAAWARYTGILVASLSAVLNLLSMPYYPLWSLIAVALDIAVIWALCVYRPEAER